MKESAPSVGRVVITESTVVVIVVANLEIDVTVWLLVFPLLAKYSTKPEAARRASTTTEARYRVEDTAALPPVTRFIREIDSVRPLSLSTFNEKRNRMGFVAGQSIGEKIDSIEK